MFNKMIQSLKIFTLKMLHPKIVLHEGVVVLGAIPYFKLPKNGRVVFGKKVILNSDFKNSNTALTFRCKFVTGYEGVIQVGENTMFNGVCVVAYESVVIGKNCQIASSTLIADTDFHPVDPAEREKQVSGQPYSFGAVKKKPIVLGDNVWVGWNSTILKGVTIGDNSIVAAGSVVLAGDYPANALIAGNPAKVVKRIQGE